MQSHFFSFPFCVLSDVCAQQLCHFSVPLLLARRGAHSYEQYKHWPSDGLPVLIFAPLAYPLKAQRAVRFTRRIYTLKLKSTFPLADPESFVLVL